MAWAAKNNGTTRYFEVATKTGAKRELTRLGYPLKHWVFYWVPDGN